MNRSAAQITEEALQLTEQEQLKIARALLEHTNGGPSSNVNRHWETEIARRIELIDTGLAKGRPFADVLKEVDKQLTLA